MPTVVASGCALVPLAGCRSSQRPGRTVLVVGDHEVDRRDRVLWKWRKGDATVTTDFGDPRGADDHAFCLYDESGNEPVLVLAASVPANASCVDGECWVRARAGARVLRYKSASRLPDGIERVVLKPGEDGAARITLQARGRHVPVPALPLGLPLRVQLQGTHGVCWESWHGAAGVRRNDARIFRGRGE